MVVELYEEEVYGQESVRYWYCWLGWEIESENLVGECEASLNATEWKGKELDEREKDIDPRTKNQ
jgi:hypothetical protein